MLRASLEIQAKWVSGARDEKHDLRDTHTRKKKKEVLGMEQELIGHTWDEWTQGSEANSSVAGTHCSFFFFFFFREKQPLCRITLQLEGVPHWEQEVDEEDVSSCCCQKDPPCQQ